jgi:fumarate hydratase subunit alpha
LNTRKIHVSTITDVAAQLCIRAAYELPADVIGAFDAAVSDETSPLGKSVLRELIENADIAKNSGYPICQDTGTAVVFVDIGSGVRITGGKLEDAVCEGVKRGYETGYLRKSIVYDPLYDRKNTGTNTPPILHVRDVEGGGLRIVIVLKGGGSENMSGMTMLNPSDGEAGVIRFAVETVKRGGANPCPPIILGIGIGGNFETAPLLAKEALLRRVGEEHDDSRYAALEKKIFKEVNKTGIGPGGFGGRVTALAVHIKTAPCHIASLPVAVNINCHAARHAEALL